MDIKLPMLSEPTWQIIDKWVGAMGFEAGGHLTLVMHSRLLLLDCIYWMALNRWIWGIAISPWSIIYSLVRVWSRRSLALSGCKLDSCFWTTFTVALNTWIWGLAILWLNYTHTFIQCSCKYACVHVGVQLASWAHVRICRVVAEPYTRTSTSIKVSSIQCPLGSRSTSVHAITVCSSIVFKLFNCVEELGHRWRTPSSDHLEHGLIRDPWDAIVSCVVPSHVAVETTWRNLY